MKEEDNNQAPMNLSGDNLFNNNLNDFTIDNPDEMPEEYDSDDDPEILEEIDRR